jgi:hypothetical protein
LNIFFEEEEEDAGSWCSDQQEGEFEAFSGDEEEDEGLEPKSLDTHSETEDEAGSAPPEVVAAAGSAPPEVVAAASTLERKCGEKRVEFRLPSAEKDEEDGAGRLAREEGRGRLARESSAEKEEGRGQIARIFSEGGLLEELRYMLYFCTFTVTEQTNRTIPCEGRLYPLNNNDLCHGLLFNFSICYI